MAQYSLFRLAPDYRRLWDGMEVTKKREADAVARRIVAVSSKTRYRAVEKRTGVPWFVVGLIHYRESNCSFVTWLHNGDPMRDRVGRAVQTWQVPPGRPPNPDCSWEDGAVDALVAVEHLDAIQVWNVESVAYGSEKVNGFGYRNPSIDIPSPYLWGGTNRQECGKYVRDRVYDPNVMDSQLGCMAVLKSVMDMDPEARFADVGQLNPRPAPTGAPATNPKATDPGQDQGKPLSRSKTLWGAILSWCGSVSGFTAGLWEHLATPWGFAVFALVVVVVSVFAFLVIKGRIDTKKLIEHLSPDGE